jgi:hypothetical protein
MGIKVFFYIIYETSAISFRIKALAANIINNSEIKLNTGLVAICRASFHSFSNVEMLVMSQNNSFGNFVIWPVQVECAAGI